MTEYERLRTAVSMAICEGEPFGLMMILRDRAHGLEKRGVITVGQMLDVYHAIDVYNSDDWDDVHRLRGECGG